MAKYLVLQKFKDIETNEVYEVDQEIELTDERAEQAIGNLKKWDGDFLKRLDDEKTLDKLTKDELKAKLTELGKTYDEKATKDELLALFE